MQVLTQIKESIDEIFPHADDLQELNDGTRSVVDVYDGRPIGQEVRHRGREGGNEILPQMAVYTKVDSTIITHKWLGTNRGGKHTPDYRSRSVARGGGRDTRRTGAIYCSAFARSSQAHRK